MDVVRITAFQPRANYRIPITVTERMSYNFLPISTAIGFVANLLGYNQWNTSESRRNEFLEILKNSKIGVFTSYEIVEIDRAYWFRNPARASDRAEDSTRAYMGIDPLPVYNLRNVMNVIYVGGKLQEMLSSTINDNGSLAEQRYVGPLNIGRAEDLITVIEFKKIRLDKIPEIYLDEPISLNDPINNPKYSFIKYLRISKRHTMMLVDIQELVLEEAIVRKNSTPVPSVFRINKDGSRVNSYIKIILFTDVIPTDSEARTVLNYDKLLYDKEYMNPVYMFNLY